MTDGTSQGLFIVVAIVIFGIFVVLAYIIFEDTLSPALASMFNEATEQASIKLNGVKPIDLDVSIFNPIGRASITDLGNNTWEIDSEGIYTSGEGIFVDKSHFQYNKRYEATYDAVVLEGEVSRWGGRVSFSENTKTYINGIIESGSYNNGFGIVDTGEPIRVRVLFDTNRLENDSSPTLAHFYIQPNRLHPEISVQPIPYKVQIINLKIKELK